LIYTFFGCFCTGDDVDHTGKPSFFIITYTKTTKENIDHTGKPSFFIITCTKTTKESIDQTGKPSFFIITYKNNQGKYRSYR
jgi:hypothetical protein